MIKELFIRIKTLIIKALKVNIDLIRAALSKEKYGIKRGYIHRKKYTYLDKTDSANENWQVEVYEFAENFFKSKNYSSVVDFGCGSAYKFLKHFSDYHTIGVEVKESLGVLKEKHPGKKWITPDSPDIEIINCDLVICADVIEHVLDPEDFLNTLNKINFKHLIISTPERDILHNSYHYGPPINPYHIREWNGKELSNFLSNYYNILDHKISNYKQATQMILCEKK